MAKNIPPFTIDVISHTISQMKGKLRSATIFLLLAVTAIVAGQDTSAVRDSVLAGVATDNRVQLAEATPDYPVTPGDQYLLRYFAHTGIVTVVFTVEGDYTLNLGIFGSINTRNMNFPQLRERVESIVKNAYPESFPHLSFAVTGSFRVFVEGEVTLASWVTVWGLSRLSDVVPPERLTPYSSIRDIEVISGSGATEVYDLFRAQRLGDNDQNPYLRPGDRVSVKKATRRVRIAGEVRRPGEYQLKAEETLQQLIFYYADGFSPMADTKTILISRITGTTAIAELLEIDLSTARSGSVALYDFDTVTIQEKTESLPVVYIEGAVLPVVYMEDSMRQDGKIRHRLREGDTLYTVMKSIRDRIDPTANLAQCIITNPSTSRQRTVDVEYLLYSRDRSTDILLAPEDRVVIPWNDFEVFLTGEVITSHWIAANRSTRLENLLPKQLTPYSSVRNVKITSRNGEMHSYDLFRAGRFGEIEQNPYLRPGDIVDVGRANRRVTIAGEVERPGSYQLLPGETLDELIGYYAGGFSPTADKETILVTRKNGSAAPAEIFEVDLTAEDPSSVVLTDLDHVEVFDKLDRLPVVYIEGAVLPDGKIRHRLKKGDTLYQVMSSIRNNIAPSANLTQSVITNPSTALQRSVDIEYLLYSGDRSTDIQLAPEDRIVIPLGDFQVFLTGEVINSEWIVANQYTRLSALLSERLTPYSSTRDIRITSRNGEENVYDLFRAQRYGEIEQNPYLKPGDVVSLSRIERQVRIEGKVERPGSYQLLEGENLTALIEEYARGFTLKADPSQITIDRFEVEPGSVAKRYYVEYSHTDGAGEELHDSDVVTVSDKLRYLDSVRFEGAVFAYDERTVDTELIGSNSFEYYFYEGERLSEAVYKVESRFSDVSDLENAYIIRNDGTRIPVDLAALLKRRDHKDDSLLENQSRIIIPFRQYFVIVSGAVFAPDRYPYIPGRDAYYYVDLAGGFNPEKHIGRAIKVIDDGNREVAADSEIGPEYKIIVPDNNPLYYITQIAAVLSALASVTALILSLVR